MKLPVKFEILPQWVTGYTRTKSWCMVCRGQAGHDDRTVSSNRSNWSVSISTVIDLLSFREEELSQFCQKVAIWHGPWNYPIPAKKSAWKMFQLKRNISLPRPLSQDPFFGLFIHVCNEDVYPVDNPQYCQAVAMQWDRFDDLLYSGSCSYLVRRHPDNKFECVSFGRRCNQSVILIVS